MPDISQLSPNGGTTVYDIKDATARAQIAALSGFTKFLGVTTTALTDGSTTNPIMINGASVTADTGAIVTYGSAEFIWNGSAWQAFGDLSALGALAYKDSASGSFTPHGSVSQPTFTGSQMTATGSFTPEGSVSIEYGDAASGYQPKGTVSTPTITVTPSTGTVNSITNVGTLPSLSATVENECLTLSFSPGTLPTKGSNQTVVTGIQSASSSQPTFTGAYTAFAGTFVGVSGSVSVTGTPSGTVSQPSFTGTAGNVSVS